MPGKDLIETAVLVRSSKQAGDPPSDPAPLQFVEIRIVFDDGAGTVEKVNHQHTKEELEAAGVYDSATRLVSEPDLKAFESAHFSKVKQEWIDRIRARKERGKIDLNEPMR